MDGKVNAAIIPLIPRIKSVSARVKASLILLLTKNVCRGGGSSFYFF